MAQNTRTHRTVQEKKGAALPPSGRAADPVGGGQNLLYLSCNNTDKPLSKINELAPYHKKQAYTLRSNVERFVSAFGIDRVGFLTLTFPDNVTDHKEAYRRFDNMRKRFLSVFFGEYLMVKERQERGAWHFHVLVQCKADIRTGFDFDAYKRIGFLRAAPDSWEKHQTEIRQLERELHRSAPAPLRNFWRMLQERLSSYGFGRYHLAPIETTIEAIGKYVGKYISKHVGARSEEDRGVRLVSYSKGFPRSNTTFAWHSDNSQARRRKLYKFAAAAGIKRFEDMAHYFGPKWAYNLHPYIDQVDDLAPHEVRLIAWRLMEGATSKEIEVLLCKAFKREPTVPVVEDGSLIDPITGEIFF